MFINAGAISLSGNILEDSMPTEQFLRNSGALCPFRISGAAPKAAPLHTVSDWNGEGRWLQIASFAFEHDADNALIANLRVREVNYREPS